MNLVLLLVLLLLSLVAKSVALKTEARVSRISTTIVCDPIFQCTHLISSTFPTPPTPPLILTLLPLPTLLDQANILGYDPLNVLVPTLPHSPPPRHHCLSLYILVPVQDFHFDLILCYLAKTITNF